MERPLVLLVLAITCEVMWAVMLKLSQGFTEFWASLAMMSAYVASLLFLSLACRQLDLSMAYAVWTGSGAALVALIGVVLFKEPLSPGRMLGFLLVTTGVVVLIGLEKHASSGG